MLAARQQLRDGDLDSDRVNGQVPERVDSGRGVVEHVHPELSMQLLEWPQVNEVEDRAHVYVEGIGPLAGEDVDPARDAMHCGLGQLRVIRSGQRADVAWRAGQARSQGVALAVRYAGHRVGLAAGSGWAGQGTGQAGGVKGRDS